jgi:hypothetical protein
MSDTVIGAIIGASVALIGMIVAKESKISELRQQWIDGLRSDVARFVSLALHVGMTKLGGISVVPDHRDANERIGLIRLRLNMKEKTSKDLIEAIDRLETNAENGNPMLEAFADDVIKKTQIILKDEWKRVKRGEWRYVTVLIIASISLVFCLGLLLYRWLHG